MFFWQRPAWDKITDPWFDSHFNYAADITAEWLQQAVSLSKSKVIDFGCGDGIMTSSLAIKYHPKQVTGIDITNAYKNIREQLAKQIYLKRIPRNLNFVTIKENSPLDIEANAVCSWSVFEHISHDSLPDILATIYKTLSENGVFFLQIEPLFYSPFGSHLGRFLSQPWAHLLMDESQLREVVFSSKKEVEAEERDGAYHEHGEYSFKQFCWDEYKKLNRITTNELVELCKKAGFVVEKEVRGHMNYEIPTKLVSEYPREILLNNEVRLLLRKLRV